jgi:hypothetical protein
VSINILFQKERTPPKKRIPAMLAKSLRKIQKVPLSVDRPDSLIYRIYFDEQIEHSLGE